MTVHHLRPVENVGTPCPRLIALAQSILDAAKAGEIADFAAVVIQPGRGYELMTWGDHPQSRRLSLLGAVTELQADLMNRKVRALDAPDPESAG